MPIVKSPATIKEQLDKLESHGCVIESRTRATEVLTRINYYRLAQYFKLYVDEDKRYRKGTSFDRVLRVYEFDKRLRSLLLMVLEEIEINFRAAVSNLHSLRYGALGYLNADTFDRKHNHPPFLTKISRMIETNADLGFVRHHQQKYAGAFPLWVIMELFSYGTLAYFYSDLKQQDKKDIAEAYGVSSKALENWQFRLAELRNHCAHYNRLYGNPFSSAPSFSEEAEYPLDNSLFSCIIIIYKLYLSKADWNGSIMPVLCSLFEKYEDVVETEMLGFPQDWEKILWCSNE